MIDLLFKSQHSLLVLTLIGIVYTVWFLILFFRKSGRDERGRAIFGTASIFSIISLLVYLNVFSLYLDKVVDSPRVLLCAIQFMYDFVMTVEMAAVLILSKIK